MRTILLAIALLTTSCAKKPAPAKPTPANTDTGATAAPAPGGTTAAPAPESGTRSPVKKGGDPCEGGQ